MIYLLPFHLTWDGHEVLAKTKSDSAWRRIRSIIQEKGGSFASSVISDLATKLALQAVAS